MQQYIYLANKSVHRLVPNTAGFQVPNLRTISLPPRLVHSTCLCLFPDLSHPNDIAQHTKRDENMYLER